MRSWGEYDGYDLSHLDQHSFNFSRPATKTESEKEYKFLISYSHHCFTSHHGEPSKVFIHNNEERFFCETRYKLSKFLPDLIKDLLFKNPYLGRTFNQHREQFFYIEHDFQYETYRVFLEISNPSKAYADIRIDVRSAHHEEEYASPVGVRDCWKIWQVIDFKIKGESLPKNKKRRR